MGAYNTVVVNIFLAHSSRSSANPFFRRTHAYETGYEQAHEWQQKSGRLRDGVRLIPKTPFILGGDYSVENLFALDAVKGMRYRADIWKQIRDLPDGTPIQLKVLW